MNPNQYPPQPGQPPQGYPPQGPQPLYPPQGVISPQPGYNAGQQAPFPPQPLQPPRGPMPPQPGYMPGYNPNPYPGEYDHPVRKRGPNKAIFGIIVIVIIITVIVVAASMSGGGNNNTGNQTQQNQTTNETESTSVANVVPRSDGQLDLRNRTSATANLKAQTVKAKEREQVNLSSGFSFMVNKVETYVSPNPTTLPAANKKFIVATVVVGNRTTAANLSVSYLDFRLRDESNQLSAGHITTNEILNNPLSNPTELKPGEQLTGKVVFEVDQTDTTWVFKHSETYQKTTDNTTFVVEGEIVTVLAAAATSPTPTPTPPTP